MQQAKCLTPRRASIVDTQTSGRRDTEIPDPDGTLSQSEVGIAVTGFTVDDDDSERIGSAGASRVYDGVSTVMAGVAPRSRQHRGARRRAASMMPWPPAIPTSRTSVYASRFG